jgi:hypothetical protein
MKSALACESWNGAESMVHIPLHVHTYRKHCVVATSAGKVASRDGLQVWQIGFANGHLRKIKERRKDDAQINENYRG